MKKVSLSKTMTIREFDTGYWYATELKDFANSIGIPSAGKLRKDELEDAIKLFLKTGKIKILAKRSLLRSGVKDTEKGLSLNLRIINYTNNKDTKDFIIKEAKKIAPNLKEKSGARYRLNRWREEQLTKGKRITYKDLVIQYIKLNNTEGRFAQAPTGRYINFLSDFLASEKNVTRQRAIEVWKELKALNIPKNYDAWKQYQNSRRSK